MTRPISPLFSRENQEVVVVSVKLMSLSPLMTICATAGLGALIRSPGAIRKSVKLNIAFAVGLNILRVIPQDFADILRFALFRSRPDPQVILRRQAFGRRAAWRRQTIFLRREHSLGASGGRMSPARLWSCLRGGDLYDITSKEVPTMRDLLERDDPVAFLLQQEGEHLASLEAVMGNSVEAAGDLSTMHLLAPCDLQAVKACWRHLRAVDARARHRGKGCAAIRRWPKRCASASPPSSATACAT